LFNVAVGFGVWLIVAFYMSHGYTSCGEVRIARKFSGSVSVWLALAFLAVCLLLNVFLLYGFQVFSVVVSVGFLGVSGLGGFWCRWTFES
jgi:hypothetical protein